MRSHRKPPAPPFVPVTGAQLRALGAVARVAQPFDIGGAPAHAAAQARAGVEAGLARCESDRARGPAVLREALEAVAQEDVRAPVVLLELQPETRAVEVSALAFVKIERQVVGAALGAAVGRALVAQHVAGGGAADRQYVTKGVARSED